MNWQELTARHLKSLKRSIPVFALGCWKPHSEELLMTPLLLPRQENSVPRKDPRRLGFLGDAIWHHEKSTCFLMPLWKSQLSQHSLMIAFCGRVVYLTAHVSMVLHNHDYLQIPSLGWSNNQKRLRESGFEYSVNFLHHTSRWVLKEICHQQSYFHENQKLYWFLKV